MRERTERECERERWGTERGGVREGGMGRGRYRERKREREWAKRENIEKYVYWQLNELYYKHNTRCKIQNSHVINTSYSNTNNNIIFLVMNQYVKYNKDVGRKRNLRYVNKIISKIR